jgi:hypothetical protein
VANEEHLTILRKGAKEWNEWRNKNSTNGDLVGAILVGANLVGANLRETDLCNADLRETDLSTADLYKANLRGAKLVRRATRLRPNHSLFSIRFPTKDYFKSSKCRQFKRFQFFVARFPSFGRGFDSHRPLHTLMVRPGHMGNRTYWLHIFQVESKTIQNHFPPSSRSSSLRPLRKEPMFCPSSFLKIECPPRSWRASMVN